MDVTAIKVKIGLRPNGHADHPDWTILPLASAGTDKPARENIIRGHQYCGGWKYDKTSGHAEQSVDSPIGMQWGMMLVSVQFATEAMIAFPALVTRLTEAETQTFWDDRAHAHMTEENRSSEVLLARHAELNLIKDLIVEFPGDLKLKARYTVCKTQAVKALDPDDKTPGVQVNRQRRWSTVKLDMEITFLEL